MGSKLKVKIFTSSSSNNNNNNNNKKYLKWKDKDNNQIKEYLFKI